MVLDELTHFRVVRMQLGLKSEAAATIFSIECRMLFGCACVLNTSNANETILPSIKTVLQLTAQSSQRKEARGDFHDFYVLHQCAASRPWPWFDARNIPGIFDMKFRW